jgi:hypothetical protein
VLRYTSFSTDALNSKPADVVPDAPGMTAAEILATTAAVGCSQTQTSGSSAGVAVVIHAALTW